MLQRDRLIRTQVQQLADASLFAMSFWLAYCLRGMPFFSESLGLGTIPPESFENVVWLYFALVPAAPLMLESQGFYNRPVISRRPAILFITKSRMTRSRCTFSFAATNTNCSA